MAFTGQTDAQAVQPVQSSALHSTGRGLGTYLAWFKWCRTFMAPDSGTAERTVARQLANGVCRSRIHDMFNVLPP